MYPCSSKDSQKKLSIPQHTLYIVVLVCIVLAVYWNTLWNGFVWDDVGLVTWNRAILSLDLHHIIQYFTDRDVTHAPGEIYRPISLLTYAINYQLSGINPFGYHLTNLIIHTLNSILIFYLLISILEEEKVALFSALLFATHPVQTEAVGWLKDRDDLLAMFFVLLSLYLYINARKNIRQRHTQDHKGQKPQIVCQISIPLLIISLFFYLLGLLSKEMAITLPLILILYDLCFSPHQVGKLKQWLFYIPYFLITLGYLTLREIVLKQVAQRGYLGGSFIYTMFTMLKVFVHYLKLLILPLNLCVDYSAFPISRNIDLFSLFIFAVVLLIGVISYKYSRVVTFAIFWFFITLLPVSNIIPIKIPMAERFLYIPSLGFVLLLGLTIKTALQMATQRLWKGIILSFLLVILAFYSIRTSKRNRDWKDNFTLWKSTVTTCPSPRAHTNLGIELFKRKRFNQAAIELKKAISSPNVDSPIPFIYLGDIYTEEGIFERAMEEYQKAWYLAEKGGISDRNPDKLLIQQKYHIKTSLGLLYLDQGKLEQAIFELKEAINIKPDNIEAYNDLGLVYMQKNEFDKAISAFKKALTVALKTDKRVVEIYDNLGQAYYKGGYIKNAIIAFKKALRIDPDYKSARKHLARAYIDNSSIDELERLLSQPSK